MSYLTDVKNALRLTQDNDDSLLNRLIDSAAAECVAFLNLTLEQNGDPLDLIDLQPASVYSALILLVQADYDGDPEKRNTYRSAAETLMQPYRLDLGL